MDHLDRLEIYIPVEAEVKSISMSSLPKSVLRRMGFPQSDSEGSRKLAESPQGIWICPAVLRRKGHKGNSLIENMSLLMARVVQAAPGPLQMSFVSSNPAAYKVLKDCGPGKNVSAHSFQSPPGMALRTYEHAVIIYHGCIYLSIRKPKRSQPQPPSQSSTPSTSDVSSESQKKELLHFNRPKMKLNTWKVTQSVNRKVATHRGRDVSSSKTARSVPRTTDGVHKVDNHCQKDARGDQAAGEAAGPEPAWFHPLEGQEAVANDDLTGEEADSTNQNDYMDSNTETDSVAPDNIVGIVEPSSNQSWTSREYQGAACASTPLYQECDYSELEQEEMINQIKAKLKAAYDNLPSLKKTSE